MVSGQWSVVRNATASKVQGAMKYVMNDAGPAADDAVTTRNIYLGAINQPRKQLCLETTDY